MDDMSGYFPPKSLWVCRAQAYHNERSTQKRPRDWKVSGKGSGALIVAYRCKIRCPWNRSGAIVSPAERKVRRWTGARRQGKKLNLESAAGQETKLSSRFRHKRSARGEKFTWRCKIWSRASQMSFTPATCHGVMREAAPKLDDFPSIAGDSTGICSKARGLDEVNGFELNGVHSRPP